MGRAARLVVVALLLTITAPIAGSSAGRSAAALDIRGDWDAPAKVGSTIYPQIWHIATENLSTGTYTGSIKGNARYTIDGQVVGHTWKVVATYGSYVSHAQATIDTSTNPWTAAGTFHDSNGTSGTWTAKRLSGPPSGSAPPTTSNPNVCVGSCGETNVSYDNSIDPGDSSLAVVTSCGAGRATSSARAVADLSCGIDDVVKASLERNQALTNAAIDLVKKTQTVIQQLESSEPAAQPDLQQLGESIQLLQTMHQAQDTQNAIDQLEQQINQNMRNAVDQLGDAGNQQLDAGLATEFASDRTTAGALAVGRLEAAPNPLLVLQSVASPHPAARAAKAFKAELSLATSRTYSRRRGEARLALVVAVLLGKQALAITSRHSATVTIAHLHAAVKAHSKRKLKLVAAGDGARLLRVLEVAGLHHKITAKLVLSSTIKGKTHTATRVVRVR